MRPLRYVPDQFAVEIPIYSSVITSIKIFRTARRTCLMYDSRSGGEGKIETQLSPVRTADLAPTLAEERAIPNSLLARACCAYLCARILVLVLVW